MIRGIWTRETVALMLIAALLPLALTWLWLGGQAAGARLVFALVVSGAWHGVFMLVRAQPPSFAGVISALAIAMLAPEGLGPVPLALGISFGTVFGELVFGGWGRNVVHPATVALAFLGFGFPGTGWPDMALPLAWAAIPAAGLGLATGVMAPGTLLGAVAVALLGFWSGLPVLQVSSAAAVVLVLLVSDPVAGASTRLGQWLNGAGYSALVLLFAAGWAGAAPVQVCIAAALLASLAAPLWDEIALALWARNRRTRHGRP